MAGTSQGSEEPPSASSLGSSSSGHLALRTAGLCSVAEAEQPPHLEEVDLHGAVAEVQDDGAAGAEPRAEVGQPGQLVPFPRRDVRPCLQQVLAHVIAEVFQ